MLDGEHATKVLAMLSQKGGAGKTTLALHLAVIAQATGRRVVLVDTDPQRSAAGWWRARAAATPELVEADTIQIAAVLEAARSDRVDLLVIDTRPSVERATLDVAKIADLALVPTRPSILDLRAIGATIALLQSVGCNGAVVLNSCPPGRGDQEATITTEARAGLAEYGMPVLTQSITQRAALSHALIDGRAVTEFEPQGKAALELQGVWQWVEESLWPKNAHL